MQDELSHGVKSSFPRFAQKRDVALCLIITLTSVIALLAMHYTSRGDALTAVITVDGKEYMTVSLTEENKGYINIPTEPPVTLEVCEGGIRFVNALCRDKLCEKCGTLTHGGNTAACLPARCIVTVNASDKKAPDGVSY